MSPFWLLVATVFPQLGLSSHSNSWPSPAQALWAITAFTQGGLKSEFLQVQETEPPLELRCKLHFQALGSWLLPYPKRQTALEDIALGLWPHVELSPAYGQGSVTHLCAHFPLQLTESLLGSLVLQALGLHCLRAQLQWKVTHPGRAQ